MSNKTNEEIKQLNSKSSGEDVEPNGSEKKVKQATKPTSRMERKAAKTERKAGSDHENAHTKVKGDKKDRSSESEPAPVNKIKGPRNRAFPIWLRLLTIFVFCVIAVVGGAMIGYGVVGHGHAMDVFKVDTWQHIFDFVNKDT